MLQHTRLWSSDGDWYGKLIRLYELWFEKYLNPTQEYVDEAEMQRTLDDLHSPLPCWCRKSKIREHLSEWRSTWRYQIGKGNLCEITLLSINVGAKNEQIYQVTRYLKWMKGSPQSHVHKCIWGKYQWVWPFWWFEGFLRQRQSEKYFEELENTKMAPYKVNIKVHNLLQDFILKGGFDIEEPAMKYSTNKQEE